MLVHPSVRTPLAQALGRGLVNHGVVHDHLATAPRTCDVEPVSLKECFLWIRAVAQVVLNDHELAHAPRVRAVERKAPRRN